MAQKYSLQEMKRLAVGGAYVPGADNKLSPREKHGRVRIAWFEFLTAAADANTKTQASGPINSGDTLALCTVPPGARIMGGRLVVDAMGAGATASIGVVGTAAKYLNAGDVSAAAEIDFAKTLAQNMGDTPADLTETQIVLTAGGANYANGKAVKGWIEYVVD